MAKKSNQEYVSLAAGVAMLSVKRESFLEYVAAGEIGSRTMPNTRPRYNRADIVAFRERHTHPARVGASVCA